jgi:hypothetical protein
MMGSVAGLAVLAALCCAVASGGERIGNPNYVGNGHFDRTMKVEFRTYKKRGRDLVNFQARDIQFYCDDGTEPRATMPIIRAPIDRDENSFEQILYDTDQGGGSGNYISNQRETIYWFGGQFLDRGKRAKGFILITDNPEEPAQGEGPPECTTGGKIPWRAERRNRD